MDRRDLDRWTSETGFNPDLIERVYHLDRILHALHDEGIMDRSIVLKGGTALNLLYLDLPRLSVDLDINYIGNLDKGKMETERKRIDDAITDLGTRLGYSVIDEGSSYIITRSKFRFNRLSGIRDHIKIELNYLDRMPLREINAVEMRPLLPFIDPIAIPTYSLEELGAQKSVACLVRNLPRDVFDTAELSKMGLDINMTKKLAAVYYCMHAMGKRMDLSFYDKIQIKRFKQNIAPFLNKGTDYPEVVRRSKAFTSEIFDLDDASRKFIDSFFDEGKIQRDFLGEDMDLSLHPALLHKQKVMTSNHPVN